MNRKTITLVLAAVLIGAFFLPYLSFGPFKASGLDVVTGSGNADKYVLALTPLAGVLLLVGALNNENYILGRPVLSLLALVGVLYLIVRTLIESKGQGMGDMFKILGVGYYLALAASLVLLVYNPKSSS